MRYADASVEYSESLLSRGACLRWKGLLFVSMTSSITATGEMADLVRAHAWASTPLGTLETWSEATLAVVNLMLCSPFPCALFRGSNLTMLYNDAYRPFAGDPSSLGRSIQEVYEEAWHILGPQFLAALEGKTTYHENFLVPLYREGVLQNCYWTYSLTPVYENGRITGVFNACQERTDAVAAVERLRAKEAEVRGERMRLLQILEQAPLCFALLSAPYHVISLANPAFAELLGNRELLGKTVREAVPEAEEQGFFAVLDRVLATGHSVRRDGVRLAVVRHPGQPPVERFLDFVLQPLRDAEDTVSGIVCFGLDVTGRRESELALRQSEEIQRQSEERLQLAMEGADLGMWFYDFADRVVVADRTMHRIFGSPERGGAMHQWLGLLHPEDNERVRTHAAEALAGEHPYDLEYRIQRPDGVRWVRSKGRVVDRPDAPKRMFAVVEDITDRKLIEADLEQSREALHMALDAGRAGTFDWDVRRGAVRWSAELERLYGVEAGTFEGDLAAWRKRVVAEDEQRILGEITEVIARRQERYGYEFRAILPDQSLRWLRGQARFVYAADGTPLRMVGINLDIHERKAAEEALIRNEKLAAVGRLASSIAHEINNPLEAVTNLLYLARTSEALPEEVRFYLTTAEAELRRASAITTQTLRFHKQATRPVEMTCEDLIGSVLTIYQSRLVNSKIKVEKRKRARRPVLCMDGEIRQGVSNLIGNAIDAMHPDGGRLLLRSRESHDWRTGRQGLVVTVADSGPGIPRETAGRIFEAFFTTKGIGGTGLGLWISKEIIDRHQGRLLLRTSQATGHSGTVFTLFLPFATASQDAEAVVVHRSPAPVVEQIR